MTVNAPQPLRLALFASGSGTNFTAILEEIEAGNLDAVVVCLVVNRQDCGAEKTAREREIPVEYFSNSYFGEDVPEAAAIVKLLQEHSTDYLVLAGFLRMLPRQLLQSFPGRVLNIHPALLPAFGGKGMYGLRVHKAVWDSGVTVSGATVHFVDEQFDHGPILLQEAVELDRIRDTPETIQQKVLVVEHRLYARALRLLTAYKVDSKNGRIRLWR
ncbi:MAG: phosphoribosylglycinamide formyltransferase [Candidatus Delongbacteria bacterium]|nr:phosphoribosylglycinamide formyltransferase [Candidatus Delongbacteria bacterium]